MNNIVTFIVGLLTGISIGLGYAGLKLRKLS